ncbi:hypothetical protein HDU79_005201 [Rhizoclosmatium sp. JEL0117]|nr:hypothetical protein HDU79_005201 [Rhizoclosmatium sp. JEL0117]
MLVLGLCLFAPVFALNNGVGRTPAMGWNSWNKFACDVNEDLIKEHADALVASGLADLGYNHINVDDCWQLTRDEKGFIHEDPSTFPSGIKALSDYIHSKGLKFGLYSSAGTMTCQRRPGGLYYEQQDAQRYAEWEIDYFKYDNCFNDGLSDRAGNIRRYGALRDALNATGRHINYALCQWGEQKIWEFGADLGNSWRTTGDIEDKWESVIDIINKHLDLSKYAGPGGFNDMDMLEVGNGHMTDEEYRTHFTVWAALKSPLLLGHDIRTMGQNTFDVIGNKEIIDINQDPLGKAAFFRARIENVYLWVGELSNGDRLLMVVNARENPVNAQVSLSSLVSTKEERLLSASWEVYVRDLWLHEDIGLFSNVVPMRNIPAHGVRILRLQRKGGDFPQLHPLVSHGKELIYVSEVSRSFCWSSVLSVVIFALLLPLLNRTFVVFKASVIYFNTRDTEMIVLEDDEEERMLMKA